MHIYNADEFLEERVVKQNEGGSIKKKRRGKEEEEVRKRGSKRGRRLRKHKFLGCEWSSRYGAKSGAASIYKKKLSAR